MSYEIVIPTSFTGGTAADIIWVSYNSDGTSAVPSSSPSITVSLDLYNTVGKVSEIAANEINDGKYTWTPPKKETIVLDYYIQLTIKENGVVIGDPVDSATFTLYPAPASTTADGGTFSIETKGGMTFVDVKALVTSSGGIEKIAAQRILKSDYRFSTLTEAEKEAEVTKTKETLKNHANFGSLPIVLQIKHEIASASAYAKMIGQNIPMLATPFTVATAAATITGVLPDLIEILINLGLELPPPVVTLIETISKVIGTMAAIVATLNTVLNVLLTLGGSDLKDLIPSPPTITLTKK